MLELEPGLVEKLTCVCGHDANSHSQKPAAVPAPTQLALGALETFSDTEDAGMWNVLQGVWIRKDGDDPTTQQVKKAKRREPLHCTAQRWRGPSGGLWAQLDAAKHGPGWVLIEGPGFGLTGPLLQRAAPAT
ncbi:unnamed protein product [Symbiodinium natans]|uniref:Uncharacterized protein n=1 Tax=Symbiodinium natans TaxID=878477 RepID=A0A812VEW7_9DINO|nr:unnamed protein product [Symbiodinium natans]